MIALDLDKQQLPAAAQQWLDEATEQVRQDVLAVDKLFPVAARKAGRGPLGDGWDVGEAARVLLLTALPLKGADLAEVLTRLYRGGSAAERRAVLKALTLLDRDGRLGPAALALTEEAVRTHDTTLVTAAMGEYGARHLDAAAYRQGILKCIFTEIPLSEIAGLPERADPELARMLAGYAAERIAAGRSVPEDIWPIIEAHPDLPETADVLARRS
ncbi:EboA domain-containing protein [Nonomuraea typhae]|uniref:EboA domain-containing protein n=1 Tax=Nonomuraea typhae TaxID=2603600 RepID=UPI0012FB2A61|nr:EboA domain-containing protein [Nonomuraea typhae]